MTNRSFSTSKSSSATSRRRLWLESLARTNTR
jgi:hypothetical protein